MHGNATLNGMLRRFDPSMPDTKYDELRLNAPFWQRAERLRIELPLAFGNSVSACPCKIIEIRPVIPMIEGRRDRSAAWFLRAVFT